VLNRVLRVGTVSSRGWKYTPIRSGFGPVVFKTPNLGI
jgi:hypothetical protein